MLTSGVEIWIPEFNKDFSVAVLVVFAVNSGDDPDVDFAPDIFVAFDGLLLSTEGWRAVFRMDLIKFLSIRDGISIPRLEHGHLNLWVLSTPSLQLSGALSAVTTHFDYRPSRQNSKSEPRNKVSVLTRTHPIGKAVSQKRYTILS